MNKKTILAIILILGIVYFGADFTDKIWIGSISITDTLSGSAKFNHGIYTDSNIYSRSGYIESAGSGIKSSAGLTFATLNNGVDDDGTDNNYFVPVTARHYFTSGSKEVAQIDSSKGVMSNTFFTLPLITNSDVADSTSNEFKMFVKGDKLIFFFMYGSTKHYFYIDLTATSDQQFIYSATCP